MKVQCDVCERAEATVLCCADEAALCERCDEKVHAANKLAGKHQRVPLLDRSSTHNPNCDICQEKAGYFFCLEDRALLCRHCDVAIHTASPYVSSHQRFLVTGVRVALQQHLANSGSGNTTTTTNDSTSTNGNSNNYYNHATTSMNSPGSTNDSPARKYRPAAEAMEFPMEEAATCFRPQWPWDEFPAPS